MIEQLDQDFIFHHFIRFFCTDSQGLRVSIKINPLVKQGHKPSIVWSMNFCTNNMDNWVLEEVVVELLNKI